MSNPVQPLVYVVGRDSAMFAVNGGAKVIAKSHFNYQSIINALEAGNEAKALALMVSPRQTIADNSDGLIEIEGRTLLFDGAPLHNAVTTRIVKLMQDGLDTTPLVNFLKNLLKNPSKRAVDELYGFLEKCDLPITSDGYFLAYKMINEDYTDLYTSTMDNSIGKLVKMKRNTVDDNKNNTCSDGLHFASLHYVVNGSYGSRNDGNRLVALKINPRHVVSIPTDYNNSKGRACRYKVLRELDWNERLPINNVGFKFSPVEEKIDADQVTNAAGTVTVNGKAPKYSDKDILHVKRLLAGNMGLTAIELETGMSRRHIARIRDGEAGAHVKLTKVAPVVEADE